jgi:hypothetical protein
MNHMSETTDGICAAGTGQHDVVFDGCVFKHVISAVVLDFVVSGFRTRSVRSGSTPHTSGGGASLVT